MIAPPPSSNEMMSATTLRDDRADLALRPQAEAERRQLTVMFCDLVGSAALAERLDPEDMGAVIGRYQHACITLINHWDGHVARIMGERVLAYFGYPGAREDDAERAVRAGLAVVKRIAELTTHEGTALAARIGIATGQVVAGDLIGEGAAREEAVVGEPPHLAARLQNLAAPGTVVIAPKTQHLVAGLFDLVDLGQHELRGFGQRVQAWQVRRASRAASRFAARNATWLSQMVGRQPELDVLRGRFARAREGDGQVVLLAGEPGIGKSRLAHALLEDLRDQQYTRIRCHCSPYHINSALHPVIEHLKRAAGLTLDDPPEIRRRKLEAMLGPETERPAETISLIGALVGFEEEPSATDHSPQWRKQRTLDLLMDQLEGLAARQPVVAVYEDVHWIDPSTLELLGMVIERIRRLPVLLVITFRPEFTPPWRACPHTTALALDRLGRTHSAAMIEQIANGRTLPGEVAAQILAKTDGVPLFVEELTKTVLESTWLATNGDRARPAGPLPPLAIPATLQDSLMARLDRLAPVKEVAQIGAVIGREFSHQIVAAVADLPAQQLSDALDRLVASELVVRRGVPPQATYEFKHALVQDAAWQSLLRSTRKRLHARIAQVLEEQFPETIDATPEVLARHCSEADLLEPAVRYWHAAGKLAGKRSALREAVAHLGEALTQLARLPATTEHVGLELEIQSTLGRALIGAKGYAAAETGQAFARARQLCAHTADPTRVAPVLFGESAYYLQRGDVTVALETARDMLARATAQDHPEPIVNAHRQVGVCSYRLGDFGRARDHLDQAIRHHRAAPAEPVSGEYPFDPESASLSHLALVLAATGHPLQAVRASDQALEIARRHPGSASAAQALHLGCQLRQLFGQVDAVRQQSFELYALSTEYGYPYWLTIAKVLRGWVVAKDGQIDDGLELIRQGLRAYQDTGANLQIPYFLILLADASDDPRVKPQSLAMIDRVQAQPGTLNDRWLAAELERVRAGLLPDRSGADAERALWRAVETARHQGARTWNLRASSDLARLLRDRGEWRRAHELLAPVYAGFTEGFETRDLTDARRLLDSLRPAGHDNRIDPAPSTAFN